MCKKKKVMVEKRERERERERERKKRRRREKWRGGEWEGNIIFSYVQFFIKLLTNNNNQGRLKDESLNWEKLPHPPPLTSPNTTSLYLPPT